MIAGPIAAGQRCSFCDRPAITRLDRPRHGLALTCGGFCRHSRRAARRAHPLVVTPGDKVGVVDDPDEEYRWHCGLGCGRPAVSEIPGTSTDEETVRTCGGRCRQASEFAGLVTLRIDLGDTFDEVLDEYASIESDSQQ